MTEVRYFVTKTGGWGAPLIRWGTADHEWLKPSTWLAMAPVNHAGVVNEDGVTVEAESGGLRYGKLSAYPDAVVSDPVGGEQGAKIWANACARADRHIPYGWLDIFAIILLRLPVHTPRWAMERLTSTDTVICSQDTVIEFAAGGIKLGDKEAAFTTPMDLWRVLHNEPEPADY